MGNIVPCDLSVGTADSVPLEVLNLEIHSRRRICTAADCNGADVSILFNEIQTYIRMTQLDGNQL